MSSRSTQSDISPSIDLAVPDVMPIDREAWAAQLHLSNFVNSYYQYRDVTSLPGPIRSILVVGPGQGLDTAIFRWRGQDVTTFDLDHTFKPDVLGSVHDLSMFGDKQFDVVIASHVLEHMAKPYSDKGLAEIARVARYALVYLPIAGRHSQARFVFGFKGIDISLILHLFNPFRRPSLREAKFCLGQHFWEVGRPGFRRTQIRRWLEKYFEVLSAYSNKDWLGSMNYVLKSKR